LIPGIRTVSTPDFFRARLDGMIDRSRPLVVLASRLLWQRIETALAPKFARRDRPAQDQQVDDLFGAMQVPRGGVSNAGRPRLAIRLMASPLCLKHSF
jgi:transposase, IS5 family